MGTGSLTQAEADALLGMEKHRIDDTPHEYPSLGGQVQIPLVSSDGMEQFILDINRGSINLAKATYQTRARTVVPLARSAATSPSTGRCATAPGANLRRMVKRVLRKYGYPPDQQESATITVLKQPELFGNDWAA